MLYRSVACAVFIWLGCSLAAGQRQQRDVMDPDFYCKDRSDSEFFRRQYNETGEQLEIAARSSCHVYYRCVPGAGATKDISRSQCQIGMYFDIDVQICQVRTKVSLENCIKWQKQPKAKPKWPLAPGEKSNCGTDEIQCGSGECMSKSLFCDNLVDCIDGSDENICTPELDPNGAPKCNPQDCLSSENCYCSVDGIRTPGDLNPNQIPQMITISFSGAVNERNMGIYETIFRPTTKNAGNGCTAKATFFVSHAFTNYSAVQELYRKGHEIATFSISNREDINYWTNSTFDTYFSEYNGNREILERFSNISQGEIIGMKVPNGRVGGNVQFQMMEESGFFYDASLAAPRNRLPLWPYILKFRMPHKCLGTDQKCPTKSFEVFEMVQNELDRRDDFEFDERLTGCHYVDQCSNIVTRKQFRRFLDNNLAHHYKTNRAPFGLHFTGAYFETRKDFLDEFIKWVEEKSRFSDHFFVTLSQVLSWISEPTEQASINNYEAWKVKCDVQGLPLCSLPNPCGKRVPRLFPEEDFMYLYTCQECPSSYPWLDNPTGDSYDFL